MIVAQALTDANVYDAKTGVDLIDAVEEDLSSFTADAAYDTIAIYDSAEARSATVVVPPARTATFIYRPRRRSRIMTVAAMLVSYDTASPTERRSEVSSMPIREFSELESAVLDRFGCDSIFRGGVLVREQFLPGGRVWRGTVSVFDLIDHPTASRCYAWSSSGEGSGPMEHVIVLRDEAAASAQAAVRAYMLHEDDG